MSRFAALLCTILIFVSLNSCKNPSSYSPADGDTASVSLGAQSGTIVAGIAGSITFAVTTKNISDGNAGTISWYGSSAGTSPASAPTGVTASVSAVSGNAAIVTISAAASTVVGSYYFKLTEGSAVSSVAVLAISSSGSKWSTWYDDTVLTATNPLSVSYDSSLDTATVTVTSVVGATQIWQMNAACQVGSLAPDTYLVSFTAWSDSGSYEITSNLQEETAWATSGYFDQFLTAAKTNYYYVASLADARKAQVTFNCAHQTGTFHVRDLKVSPLSAYPLTLPTDATSTFDGTRSKTKISFSKILAASDIYLYENTSHDPATAVLLADCNQTTLSWSGGSSRKESMPVIDSSLVSGFTVSGYSATGTYYYWITAKVSGGIESAKISAGSVIVSGDFANYAYVPANADCRSIGGGNWQYNITTTGTDTPLFFYATAGSSVTFGGSGTATATVGVKIYLAAASPATYVLGSSGAYVSTWQTTAQTFTIPTSGYYVIDRYNVSAGTYYMGIQ